MRVRRTQPHTLLAPMDNVCCRGRCGLSSRTHLHAKEHAGGDHEPTAQVAPKGQGGTSTRRESGGLAARYGERRLNVAASTGAVLRVDRPVRGIRDLVVSRDCAQAEVDNQVASLRSQGVGWVSIGQALGVSRQGSRQRYADVSLHRSLPAASPRVPRTVAELT
jgi:hypothetical protein